jgi:hypothetical protein
MTLTAALLAALAVSAVSLATGGDDEAAADRPARASAAGLLAAANGGAGAGVAGLPDPEGVLRSLAGRLGVSEADLHEAIRAAAPGQARAALRRAVRDGTITTAERRLALRCATDRERCDREEARALAERLGERVERDGLRGLGLGELRDAMAGDVAQRIGREGDDVVAAVRAELEATLSGVRETGLITQRAQDLALACFDDPDTCDVRALEREVPLLQGLHGGLGRRD